MPPKKDPFAGDDNEDAANRRAAARVREAQRSDDFEQRIPPRADDDDEEEIEIGAPADDDKPDDDEDREPSGRPSRSERRRQRGDDLLRVERERADRLEKLIADQTAAFSRLSQPQQPVRQEPAGPDPLDAEAETLRAAQEGLQARFVQAQQNKAGPEAIKALQAEAWSLKDKIDSNSFRRMQKAHGPKQSEAPMSAQQVRDTMIQEEAKQRFGDVLAQQQHAQLFQAKYLERRALGEPDGWATMESAATDVRRHFRLRPPGGTAPTEGEKRRLSGQSRGAGSARGDSGGSKLITPTKEMRRMAAAAYPHIKDPKKQLQQWVNGPGARLRAAGKI